MTGLKKIEITSDMMNKIVEDYLNCSLLHPDARPTTVKSIDSNFGVYTVNLEESPTPLSTEGSACL